MLSFLFLHQPEAMQRGIPRQNLLIGAGAGFELLGMELLSGKLKWH
jgi:hypothetical protein